MNKKIVIVGAGPAGCYTAQILKKYGYYPLLIEEHNEVGRPLHCTGLVGSRLFTEKRAVKISPRSIINQINGAVIHYDGDQFAIRRDKVAYVIDREKFDKELSAGLNILYGSRFLGLEKARSNYIIDTDREEFTADIVIGADGANSIVRKLVCENGNLMQYKGIQLRLKAKPRCRDMVEVYLRRNYFVWIVPETGDVVRIGTISENPHKDLQNFMEERNMNGQILEKIGGLVSVGICGKTVKENIALVGDAACQLKPLTYGGVYFGLKCANILASCIRDNRLRDYDSLWKK